MPSPPGPAFLGAQNRGNRENAPKSQNFGKISHFGVISHIFTLFGEKGEKCPKWAPGGAPRSGTVKTNRFLGGFEAPGAENAVWG